MNKNLRKEITRALLPSKKKPKQLKKIILTQYLINNMNMYIRLSWVDHSRFLVIRLKKKKIQILFKSHRFRSDINWRQR